MKQYIKKNINNVIDITKAVVPISANEVASVPALASAMTFIIWDKIIHAAKEIIIKRVFIALCSFLKILDKNKNNPAKQMIARITAIVYGSAILSIVEL